jgi:UDPglucose--hexose-1-phosphate uridylyltransferase
MVRPWQGQVEPAAPESRPRYDPGCYLCPGNARAGGQRNPDYEATFVFDNDFPALLPDAAEQGLPRNGGGLLRADAVRGVCRVVCFSPRHDLSLGEMPVEGIRRVVDAWAEEVARLAGLGFIRHVQVFENRGAMMGCSNPHPHGQIWATDHVPALPARRLESQRRHLAAHGRDLLGEYLEQELRAGERVVAQNERFVVLVPFWAVWPFETLVVPRRRVADLPGLEPDERDALAGILKDLNARYDRLFSCPFPYSMAWLGRPIDGESHPEWRLHATYLPPLLRSATVRKFLVGYELTAEPQRDLTAESAAERLREAGRS